jgi:protease I
LRAAQDRLVIALNRRFIGAMPKPLLALVDDIYEDLELRYPKLRMEEAGFATRLAGPALRTFGGKHGYPATANLLITEAAATD